MVVQLTKGGNVSLTKQAPGLTGVTVGLGWRTERPAGGGPDAGALLCDQDGRALSGRHVIFFDNLASPDGSVRHSTEGGAAGGGEDDERIQVDLVHVPDDVAKVVFAVSLPDTGVPGAGFAQVQGAYVRVVDQDGGAELARYDVEGRDLAAETAVVFGELYRHGAEWKFRAIGQGYTTGIAGIAADYGIEAPTRPRSPAAPGSPDDYATRPPTEAFPAPPAFDGSAQPPAAFPAGPAPTPAAPAPPAFAPTAPGVPVSQPTGYTPTPPSAGGQPMLCFFDPGHGPATAVVTWSPQWGAPRPVDACEACAQRVQTTPPPFYTPAQEGYPQPGHAQPGYPQAGYPQAGYPGPGYPGPGPYGYPQQGHPHQGYPSHHGDPYHGEHGGHHGEHGGRRFGAGALIGAGAAGLIGGALLNEAFDDDQDVIVDDYDGEE